MNQFRRMATDARPRQYVGFVLLASTLAWTPRALYEFEFALVQILALLLIGLGLAELVRTKFVKLGRCAFLITLGVGLQLLALDLLTFGELLTLWPLALVTFGAIILLADLLEERYFPRSRYYAR